MYHTQGIYTNARHYRRKIIIKSCSNKFGCKHVNSLWSFLVNITKTSIPIKQQYKQHSGRPTCLDSLPASMVVSTSLCTLDSVTPRLGEVTGRTVQQHSASFPSLCNCSFLCYTEGSRSRDAVCIVYCYVFPGSTMIDKNESIIEFMFVHFLTLYFLLVLVYDVLVLLLTLILPKKNDSENVNYNVLA